MPENNESVPIEVYKEHTAFSRHEDNILYRFGRFMVPTSFALLGVPYIADIEESNLTILEIISTVGGMILMTFWVCYVCATHAKILARLQIINQIERDWGLKGHKDVPNMRDKIFGKPWLFQLRTHFLEKLIFYVYLGMVVLLTVGRIYYKFYICKSFALATASFLPLDIMFICLVIALRYDCRIRRGEKRLDSKKKLCNSQHI